jgi:hypothetical protein
MATLRQTPSLHLGVRDLVAGDHVVAFVESTENQINLVADFIAAGIDKGGKAVFITEAMPAHAILQKLKHLGHPVDDLLARGQLVGLDSDDTYLEGGYFSAARMVGKLNALIKQTAKEGWSHLCLTGEASWALPPAPGVDELAAYEAEANALISQSNCVALCLYDVRLFGNRLHGDLLASHSHVVLGFELFDVLK